jgi:hypothetical protein
MSIMTLILVVYGTIDFYNGGRAYITIFYFELIYNLIILLLPYLLNYIKKNKKNDNKKEV